MVSVYCWDMPVLLTMHLISAQVPTSNLVNVAAEVITNAPAIKT